MDIEIVPGGRLYIDREHVMARFVEDRTPIRAQFVRRDGGTQAVYTGAVAELDARDAPVEYDLDDLPPGLLRAIRVRGFDLAYVDEDAAGEEDDTADDEEPSPPPRAAGDGGREPDDDPDDEPPRGGVGDPASAIEERESR